MALAAGLRLDLRQTQGLVLTPQLQQAIKLLQLSNLELSAAVDREVAENPFLERAEGLHVNGVTAPVPAPVSSAPGPIERDEGWWQPSAGRAADCTLGLKRATRGQAEGELPSLEARLTRPRGLREHLLEQIGGARDVAARALAATLIDWLDQDGYLRESDADLGVALGTSVELVAAARALLQACDPAGVGACDLAQCLGLQLRERDRLDPAMQALLANLPLLARAERAELMRRCAVDAEDLQDMIHELKELEPRPARSFGNEDVFTVIPDVLVFAGPDHSWRVELNSGDPAPRPGRPLLSRHHPAPGRRPAVARVSERAAPGRHLARQGPGPTRPHHAQGRARDLRPTAPVPGAWRPGAAPPCPARHRRADRAAREHREPCHRRQVCGDTARNLSAQVLLHDRDRSRVRARSPTVPRWSASRSGSSSSARVPDVLSDDQIVVELRRMGAVIARRTVAKYRESLGIPSSVERRRAKALSR